MTASVRDARAGPIACVAPASGDSVTPVADRSEHGGGQRLAPSAPTQATAAAARRRWIVLASGSCGDRRALPSLSLLLATADALARQTPTGDLVARRASSLAPGRCRPPHRRRAAHRGCTRRDHRHTQSPLAAPSKKNKDPLLHVAARMRPAHGLQMSIYTRVSGTRRSAFRLLCVCEYIAKLRQGAPINAEAGTGGPAQAGRQERAGVPGSPRPGSGGAGQERGRPRARRRGRTRGPSRSRCRRAA